MSMMAEGEPPPDDEMAEGPLPPQEEVGEPAEPAAERKTSQEEAFYREGNPQRSCGLCGHFDSKGHSCDVVEGEISPFGFSDLYLRQDNPFREGEKDSFKGGKKVLPIGPPIGQSANSPPLGPMQIGRQSYGGEA
jgi:hypothetical protein